MSHLFIHNAQFLGVMKSSIIKEFHDIKLKIDFYKILSNDRQLIEMVKNDCEKDHSNVDTLKLVSVDLIYSKLMNYAESENFVTYLRFIYARNIQDDMQNNRNWLIDFKFNSDVNFFKIVLNSLQVLRLYTQVDSFYSNYLILSSMMRRQVSDETSEETLDKKQQKKVTEYVPVQEQPVVTPHELISRERNELDDIFELCLNGSVKSSLIHYTFNHFKYITDQHVKIQTSDKNQVLYTLPLLIPKTINEQYLNSLIVSNASISLNTITFAIKKILHNLHTNHKKYQENPLYLMMVSYLLFIYLLRYVYDSNRDSYRIYFKQFINDAKIQNLLFSKIITTNFPDFAAKVYFKIIDIDMSNVSEDYNMEKINKLSSDYRHLIPVSQKEFVNKIFSELKNDSENLMPINFKLSCKKVIDVTKIMNDGQRQMNLSNSVFLDPDNILNREQNQNQYKFLDYSLQSNNGSKVITKAYAHLLNYVKNPTSVLLLGENVIPKEIKNMFEILSKKVLNVSKISKDNISTYSYYNILLENLPNPKEFSHITFLYIIFQLMIPYVYDIYNNSQFEDVFL